MMKLRSIALAAAALASTPLAFAAPSVNINAPETVKIYMSGASALRAVVAGVVLNDVCGGSASNATTTLYNLVESGSGFDFQGNNLWAISCRVTAAGGALVGLPANTPVAFFKTDAGGSAQGVFPVQAATARPFVDAAALGLCTVTTPDRVYSKCSGTRDEVPMFGISDVEPGLFKGMNVPADDGDPADDSYPSDGLSPSQLGELTVKPVVQTIFGVAVNTALYNDMFAKQGLANRKDFAGAACTVDSSNEPCVPSIGLAEARSLFAGTQSNWRLLSANADKLNTQVNICRRVAGSGTQAAANAHLMGFPCNSNPVSPAAWDASSSASPAPISSATLKTVQNLDPTGEARSIEQYLADNIAGVPAGQTFVFEGPGTGDVVKCLNAAESAGGYAIGHVSRENAPGSNKWKHVRLEGTFPSRDAAKAGQYDYVYESTVQWKNDYVATLSANQQSFISKLAERMAQPDSLNRLSGANQNGVAAMWNSYAGTYAGATGNAAKFGSRVTRGGNSCTPMTAIK